MEIKLSLSPVQIKKLIRSLKPNNILIKSISRERKKWNDLAYRKLFRRTMSSFKEDIVLNHPFIRIAKVDLEFIT